MMHGQKNIKQNCCLLLVELKDNYFIKEMFMITIGSNPTNSCRHLFKNV